MSDCSQIGNLKSQGVVLVYFAQKLIPRNELSLILLELALLLFHNRFSTQRLIENAQRKK